MMGHELPDAESLSQAAKLRMDIEREDVRHQRTREGLIKRLNRIMESCLGSLSMVRRIRTKGRKNSRKGKAKIQFSVNRKGGASLKGSSRLFDADGNPTTTLGCAYLILKESGSMHLSELTPRVMQEAKKHGVVIKAKNEKSFGVSLSTQLYKKTDVFEKLGDSKFGAKPGIFISKG